MASSVDSAFARAMHLHQQGRLPEAFAAYNAILANAPAHAPSLHYSALILHQSGHTAAALPRLERSLEVDPRSADAWSNLALLYSALGRTRDALSALRQATKLAPRDAPVWENYAAQLVETGALADAEHAARRATDLDARAPGAWYNLAIALHGQHRHAEALQAIGRARALVPDAAPLAGLEAAIVYARDGPGAARVVLETVLARRDDAGLRFQLATLCERSGDLVAAASAYQGLLEVDAQGAALSQLLFLRKRLADWRDLDALRARFCAGIQAKLPLLSPFCLLSDPGSRAQQRQCAESWVRGLGLEPPPHAAANGAHGAGGAAHGVGSGRLPWTLTGAAPTGAAGLEAVESGDRLTIGYLSADFHMHATALLTVGLFERHDRKRYHVIGYSTGRNDESPLRKRIESAFETFVDAHGWRAEQLAARIRADGVGILVDLKGHTEDARMDVLAQRPAPIQVSYLGYPGTTGAHFIDYVLADSIVTPLAHAADYTETIVQLPGCYQPNDRTRVVGDAPTREALGLPPKGTVLCCFNQIYKINPEVLDAWAAILERVSDAVLWLLARENDPAIAHLRREATQRGIHPTRLVFASTRPNAAYLALYTHADLCLDTWPYNGHTTTSDALWAGCPVVTWLGDTFAGRVAASIVTAAGLPELVASSVAEYVELACTLATDRERCSQLRRYLGGPGRMSRLFDADALTRDVERAFAAMVEQQRAGRRAPITLD